MKTEEAIDDTEQSKLAQDFFTGLDKPGTVALPTEKKFEEQKPVEEEEEKEDELPDFTRPEPAKQKKTPEESFGELRKKKDEYERENKSFKEILGAHKPEVFKPITDFLIDRLNGVVTPESVAELIEAEKQKDEEIEALRSQLEEKEKVVTELDIRHSTEFKTKFLKPFEQAQNSLLGEVATVGTDGKILGEKSTLALHQLLASNADKLDAIQIKAALASFKKDFNEEVGHDPEMPTVSSVAKAVREFQEKKTQLQEAHTNWAVTKEESQKKTQAQKEQEFQLSQQANARERKQLASKGYIEFPLDEYDFLEEKEVKDLFTKEYLNGEKGFKGEIAITYDQMLQRGVKAELWDKYGPQLKKLLDQQKSEDEDERLKLRGADRPNFTPKGKEAGLDFLTHKF